MPSNHTTIGASVKSDVGEKHTVILYNNIDRHARPPNNTKQNTKKRQLYEML